MRKSNWIIIAIVIAASIIFLAMWYYFGFNYVDDPLDLVITILWWLLVIVICLAIRKFEKDRQRTIRTVYVGNDLIYNSEAGIVRINPGESYVAAIQELLSELEYNFERQEAEEDDGKRARFRYVVHTEEFNDDGKTWEGEVVKVTNPDNPYTFENVKELTALLEK